MGCSLGGCQFARQRCRLGTHCTGVPGHSPCRSRHHCPLCSCRDPVPGHRCRPVSPSGRSRREHSQETFCNPRSTDRSSVHQTLLCNGTGQREHRTGDLWSQQRCSCKPGTPALGPGSSTPLRTPHTSDPGYEEGKDTLQNRGDSYSEYVHSRRVYSHHPGTHRSRVNTCRMFSHRHLVYRDTGHPLYSCLMWSPPHCSCRAHSHALCPAHNSQAGTGHTAGLSLEVCNHTAQSPDGTRQKGSRFHGSYRPGNFWQSQHLHRSHLHTFHNGHHLCSTSTSDIPR